MGKIKLCDYGCGLVAKYQLKNGKWCCNKSCNSCSAKCRKHSLQIKKLHRDPDSKYNSISCKEKKSKKIKDIWNDIDSIYNSKSYKEKQSSVMKNAWDNPNSKYNSIEYKENQINNTKKAHSDPNSKFNSNSYRKTLSDNMKKAHKDPNSKFNSSLHKEKQSNSHKLVIKQINTRYPFFSKIEEMRYNPNAPIEKREIQVHCKNHECENSKEKGGWFTPTYTQLYERIRQLEKDDGIGGSYFYCSQYCKDTCPLYNVYGDPYKDNTLPYTYAEYKVCRAVVFGRENTLCEYCGEPATHMHHIFPVKLEPFFALDPDYCVACCEKHHYKYAHKDECSTGNLAKIVCSVESQKFLNQK